MSARQSGVRTFRGDSRQEGPVAQDEEDRKLQGSGAMWRGRARGARRECGWDTWCLPIPLAVMGRLEGAAAGVVPQLPS